MAEELYFPLFMSIKDKMIIVFGGGQIATRRIGVLLQFQAQIKVIATECSSEIRELEKSHNIVVEQREYKKGEIQDSFFVLAATNNLQVNDLIYEECKQKGILVNHASDRNKCDFLFPGIAQKDSLVIGVTANGTDHKRAKRVTDQLRSLMVDNLFS